MGRLSQFHERGARIDERAARRRAVAWGALLVAFAAVAVCAAAAIALGAV